MKPSNAFIGASWTALLTGFISFNVGLWHADMLLNEKGYFFAILMYGLYAAVSLQKAVRDQLENIPVTNLYYGISWFSVGLAVLLLIIGLWHTEMARSEKGFYAMSYILSMFAVVAVQKNTRDSISADKKG